MKATSSVDVDFTSMFSTQGPNLDDFVEIRIFFDNLPKDRSVESDKQFLFGELVSFSAYLTETFPEFHNFLWYRDAFHMETELDPIPHLSCRMRVGDSMEDEWLVVLLLQKITDNFRYITAQVKDADGEFILIETALSIPSWLEPDNAGNRVFIREGALCIVQQNNDEQNCQKPLELIEGLKILQNDSRGKCFAVPAAQRIFLNKLKKCQEAMNENSSHYARCILPRCIAKTFLRYPHLVSVALDYLPPSNEIEKRLKDTGKRRLLKEERTICKQEEECSGLDTASEPVFNFTDIPKDFDTSPTKLSSNNLFESVSVVLRFTRMQYARLQRLRFSLPAKFSQKAWLCPQINQTISNEDNADSECSLGTEMTMRTSLHRGAQLCLGLQIAYRLNSCFDSYSLLYDRVCIHNFLSNRQLSGSNRNEILCKEASDTNLEFSLLSNTKLIQTIQGEMSTVSPLTINERFSLLQIIRYLALFNANFNNTNDLYDMTTAGSALDFQKGFRSVYWRTDTSEDKELMRLAQQRSEDSDAWLTIDEKHLSELLKGHQNDTELLNPRDQETVVADDFSKAKNDESKLSGKTNDEQRQCKIATKIESMLQEDSDYTGVETLQDKILHGDGHYNCGDSLREDEDKLEISEIDGVCITEAMLANAEKNEPLGVHTKKLLKEFCVKFDLASDCSNYREMDESDCYSEVSEDAVVVETTERTNDNMPKVLQIEIPEKPEVLQNINKNADDLQTRHVMGIMDAELNTSLEGGFSKSYDDENSGSAISCEDYTDVATENILKSLELEAALDGAGPASMLLAYTC